jgi:tRNA-Thr(GGU) m(6)t(6)A37 methyltransferase TsaA
MQITEITNEGIHIIPVGVIKNDLLTPPLVVGENGLTHNVACTSAIDEMAGTDFRVSEIILAKELNDLLDGIEEYSHIVIVYWGHEISEHGRALKKTHPAGLTQYPMKGIYATCSPARPNPVLTTVVKLLKKEENRLFVSGLDAINNSPVIDIKPYVPVLFPQDGVLIPEWMTNIMKEFH